MDIRDKILEAATAVYAESGFRGATTRRIADQADVNEVTIFRNFGSKEALLREVIARRWGMLEIPTLPAEPTDPEAELIEWALQFTGGHRPCASFIRTRLGEFEEHPELLPPSGSPTARSAALLAEYIDRLRDRGLARADVNARSAAALLVGALFNDVITRDGVPEMFGDDATSDLKDYVGIFLRGIGAP